MPSEDTQFKPGHPNLCKPGNVHGRQKVLGAFDKFLTDHRIEQLVECWKKEWDKNPLAFYNKYIYPLLPKESKIEVNELAKVPIRIIFPGDENEKEKETQLFGDETKQDSEIQ